MSLLGVPGCRAAPDFHEWWCLYLNKCQPRPPLLDDDIAWITAPQWQRRVETVSVALDAL